MPHPRFCGGSGLAGPAALVEGQKVRYTLKANKNNPSKLVARNVKLLHDTLNIEGPTDDSAAGMQMEPAPEDP
eukprot:gene32-3681_t